MAGLMDMLLDKLHLNADDEDFYEFNEDEEIEEAPKKKASKKSNVSTVASADIVPESQKPMVKVKPSRSNSKVIPMRNNLSSMEVCVIKPSNFDEDAREISDTLLSGRAVIINLEGVHVNTAQRILDFTGGACYAINGNLKLVSNYIFIATPEAVDISGDFQELLGGVAGSDSSSITGIRPNF